MGMTVCDDGLGFVVFCFVFFFKQKTAYEMRISDWSSDVCSSDLPAIDRRMVDRNAAFRQHFLKVAIADRIATIPAHRPQDHITLEMAPLEIRHRSVRPISAKHAQASRFLQQSPASVALHHKLCHTLGGTFDMPHAQT